MILAKWAQHPGFIWGVGGALMENMGGVCSVLPKTRRVHPLRSVARATQTIDQSQGNTLHSVGSTLEGGGAHGKSGWRVRVGVGSFGKYGGGYALSFLKSLPEFTPYLLS